jgi:hypothetical protein
VHGFLHDQLDADGGGEMKHYRRTVDQFGDERFIEDAVDGVVELLVTLEVRDVVDASGREIVENEDLVAHGKQRLGQVRANKAGAAGDQNPHDATALYFDYTECGANVLTASTTFMRSASVSEGYNGSDRISPQTRSATGH